MVIHSDDPNRPEIRLPLSGHGVGPIMEIAPSAYDFEEVPIGGNAWRPASIRNGGTSALVMEANSFEVTGQPGGAISLRWRIEDRARAPFLQQQVVLQPGERVTLWLHFEPVTAGQLCGFITLNTNDPTAQTYSIILSSVGV